MCSMTPTVDYSRILLGGGDTLNADHEAHLTRILSQLTRDLRSKYENGQREHGGNLWLKSGMLDNAIAEVLDLAVYLYTLKEQLTTAKDPPHV